MDYSYNDWRTYLAHEHKSKWTTEDGKNTPEYNHKYWEEHKEEILAKRHNADGMNDYYDKNKKSILGDNDEDKNVRKFDRGDGQKGIGYKIKKDADSDSYEDTDDWSGELSDDEKKNIEAHNKTVEDNIAKMTKTVEDYLAANADKLSDADKKKLRDDLHSQIAIAQEQKINTKNSDDKAYIMDLRKKASSGSSSSSSTKSASGKLSSKSSSSSSSNSSSSSTSSTSSNASSSKEDKNAKKKTAIDTLVEKYSNGSDSSTKAGSDAEQQRQEQLEQRRKEEEEKNKNAKHSGLFGENDWRSYLMHRR